MKITGNSPHMFSLYLPKVASSWRHCLHWFYVLAPLRTTHVTELNSSRTVLVRTVTPHGKIYAECDAAYLYMSCMWQLQNKRTYDDDDVVDMMSLKPVDELIWCSIRLFKSTTKWCCVFVTDGWVSLMMKTFSHLLVCQLPCYVNIAGYVLLLVMLRLSKSKSRSFTKIELNHNCDFGSKSEHLYSTWHGTNHSKALKHGSHSF